jgi:hypothetical protein
MTAGRPVAGDPARAGREPALVRLDDAIRRLARLTRGRPRTGLDHHAADDDRGTVTCDDAIGFDPRPLLLTLARHRARVVVIGQVAGILHGSSDLTGDLDLLWDGGAAQRAALSAGFSAAGAALLDDDERPVPCTPEAFELPKISFRSRFASGDCCTPNLPWKELPVREFIDRARSVRWSDGHVIRYVDLPDLNEMRRAAGRPKDLRRLREFDRRRPEP